MPFRWNRDTRPFSGTGGAQPGRFVLRQTDDDTFSLEETFVFRRLPGMGGGTGQELAVTPALLPDTDLASIPRFLGWFARRHGRHTPAALLHDLLITDEKGFPPDLPEEWRLEPEAADLLFREMLIASDVPIVRAYGMWAGVTARTRWYRRPWVTLALAVWMVLAVAGSVLLIVALITGTWWLAVAAVLAPAVASVLWGGQYPAGIVAGYAFWLVVVGSVPAYVAYHVYWVIEFGVQQLRKVRQAGRPATEEPPPPPAFSKR